MICQERSIKIERIGAEVGVERLAKNKIKVERQSMKIKMSGIKGFIQDFILGSYWLARSLKRDQPIEDTIN